MASQAAAFAKVEALLRSNKPSEALRASEKLLRLQPESPAVLRLAGIAAYLAGDDLRAVGFLSKCTALDSQDMAAWINLGNAFQRLGRVKDALAAFDRVVAAAPRLAVAHFNRGNALQALGRSAEAVEAYSAALAIEPSFIKGHLNLGLALKALGRLDEATAAYRRALALNPDYAEAHTNLGAALQQRGECLAAIAAHRRAIALNPHLAQAYVNLGNALVEAGEIAEGVAAIRRAIVLKPDLAEAHYNLGCAVSELGEGAEAVAAFRRAISAAPDHANAHFNLAFELLRLGEWKTGWAEYEWRWRRDGNTRRPFAQPQWAGEPLDGRTILLHAEQGLGDTLQFIRYAGAVAARGGKVVLEVQPCLRRLLGATFGWAEILGHGDPLPTFDVHCPLATLPGIFGSTPADIPSGTPYLEAERAALWRERLPKGGLLVGVNWQGNPAAKVERGRSVPLRHLAPLAAVPGVHLVSLQKVHGLDQLDDLPVGMVVETLGADFDDGPDAFIDTAAVMANLDLVVTSDTSVAHLAGALGRPVWVLLKHLPEWRWLLAREDSPWYPSARLFRQALPGDWEGVAQRVAAELKRLASRS